jgi:hypothetical protein
VQSSLCVFKRHSIMVRNKALMHVPVAGTQSIEPLTSLGYVC